MAESVEASVFHPVTIFFLIRGMFYMVFMKIFRYVLILYDIDAYSVAGHSPVTVVRWCNMSFSVDYLDIFSPTFMGKHITRSKVK